jgi:hypothetical protein
MHGTQDPGAKATTGRGLVGEWDPYFTTAILIEESVSWQHFMHSVSTIKSLKTANSSKNRLDSLIACDIFSVFPNLDG